MKRPSDKILRGLQTLIPVMAIVTEQPNDTELQECSEAEVEDACAALDWIASVVHQYPVKERAAGPRNGLTTAG